ncbi:MAP10 protein, partial [Geococcyx californianus]|nr:MAP10 protein [Geococcyx californianus]
AEGLFALEVVVEVVRVAALPLPPGPALRTAVALRLLDFPTLLVRPAAPQPPLQPGQPLPFGRGKRCLCGVCLAPAAAALLQRPGAAASCGRRGRFPLRDPTGRPVGELVLGYRLSRLEARERPSPASPGLPAPPAASPESRGGDEEGEELESNTPPATSPEPEGEEEELEGNIFCPPVLYYSREPAERHVPPAATARAKWEHVEAGRPREPDKGQIPPRPSAGPSLLHPGSPQQLHNTLGQLPLLSALLAELSVLTHGIAPAAVHPHLAWLYQAPRSSGMALRPPSPSSSSALKPAEIPAGLRGSGGATSVPFKQGQQETTTGSSRAGRRPKKAVHQRETGSERQCTTKENRAPRRKLLYGLTNTLRLRLQQNNPDKLIIHEKREQYRKKQMEMLKERSPLSKRKLFRNAGEKDVVSCRHWSKGDSSKQNNQLDKNVETSLQNSVLSEYISMTGDVSPDLQKQAIESLLKNNEIVSKECLCKVITASLVDEPVPKSAHKEKYAKAQVPEAFPAGSNAKGSNEEVRDLIHHKTTEHDDSSAVSDDKLSPSRSVKNNSEFVYSDDFVVSPENTVHSVDFTSAEGMSKDLEALDSSPEPLWPESLKQGWSDTELESDRSRISKTSQRAESTSDLLPVPSVSSPVQSLKRNHDLKNSKRSSDESVESLNCASIQPRLLGEGQENQQISKEESRDDQHFKQVSTWRNKQANSDTDVNTGKGQTSTGKSQSVTRESSYLPSDMSDTEFNALENSMSDKGDDFLEKLCLPSQYKTISELVINRLPGYTM